MPIEAYENLKRFTEKRSSKYPAFNRLSHAGSISYFTYLRFSPHLRRMLCTTHWIERLNRSYKRTLHMRAAMPSPEAVLFLLGSPLFIYRHLTFDSYHETLTLTQL